MKKLFLLIASALVLVPATVFAQEITRTEDKNTVTYVEETDTPEGKVVTTTVYQKNSVFTNGFWSNWTLGIDLGPHMYYGDNDWKVAKRSLQLYKNKILMLDFLTGDLAHHLQFVIPPALYDTYEPVFLTLVRETYVPGTILPAL